MYGSTWLSSVSSPKSILADVHLQLPVAITAASWFTATTSISCERVWRPSPVGTGTPPRADVRSLLLVTHVLLAQMLERGLETK